MTQPKKNNIHSKTQFGNAHKITVAVWRDRWLYIILVPTIVYFFLFKYIPMGGIIMAFQDFNMFKGIKGSEFVGFKVFEKIFNDTHFWKTIRNTLFLNLTSLIVSFPLTIILALALNEIKADKFKKFSQSLLYLPHFVSWVVVAGIATNLFNMTTGTINGLIKGLGFAAVPFLSDNAWWVFTYVVVNIWKNIGWGTIIYLGALAGVDESLYEAAYLDGATKFQRIIYVTLPSIKNVMVTMLILEISKMMSIGLDAPLLLGNDKVMGISDVISTYVYRLGILSASYSEATAIGLFQSVVNIIILVIADRFAKLIGEEGIL